MTATPLVPTAGPAAATPQLLGVTVEAAVDSVPPASGPTSLTEATPEPTRPVMDEALPAWTIMVYSSADNAAWRYTWDAVNEMEAAGASGQVQVVAAVDWPPGSDVVGSLPARYVIRGNNDPEVVTSEEAVGAEETNFGDPHVLSDFITWAISTYPANQYALVLDGYGGGWPGCCLDQDPATDDPADSLSLAEISAALGESLTGSSPPRLDLIAFTGSLMGQLDVFQAVAPYADFAVASAAPVPGSGWNYQTVLGALYANPWQDGRELARLLTEDYTAYNRDLLGNQFVAMTAVDLSRLPALSTSVETLALALVADEATAGAAADARRGAQAYGAVLADLDDNLTAVDLDHAAALLAERSPSAGVTVSARAVAVAAQDATVAQSAGDGLPFARGMSLFWPVTTSEASAAYAELGSLPAWATYLGVFTTQTASLEPPFVSVASSGGAQVNETAPVLLQSEVIGRQLDVIQTITTQPDEAGAAQVVAVDALPPPLTGTTDETTGAYIWPDGRLAAELPWDATAGYLYDAAGTATTALFRSVDASPAGSLIGVSGRLQPASEDKPRDAVLEFPAANPVPAHVWHLAQVESGSPLVHEIPAASGDQFTPRLFRQIPDGRLEPMSGEAVRFDEVPTLYRSTRPLDNGAYAVGVFATVVGGNRAGDTVDVTVDRAGAVSGFRAHVATDLGLSFIYPEAWTAPQTAAGSIHTADPAGDTTLQVRTVDAWSGDAATLLADVFDSLGGVTTLFEDTVAIGPETEALMGVRKDYGYTGADGRVRTGILTAFVKNGQGYIIDLDGLQSEEAALVEIANAIAATWRFLPPTASALEGWGQALLGGYDVAYPLGLTFEEVNGWYRFVSGDRFIAVRVQPITRAADEALAALAAAAGEGVAGFQVTGSGPRYLAGHLWQQSNFTYQNATGTPIDGTILTRPDGQKEIAVWSEWSIADDGGRNAAIALAVAASMRPNPAAEAGN